MFISFLAFHSVFFLIPLSFAASVISLQDNCPSAKISARNDFASFSQEDNQLTTHLTLDIPNAQIATFIPDWNKVNQALISGKMDKEEYDMWLEDTLKLFNVPTDEYI